MIEKCIRIVGVIVETISSVFKKRSPFRVDPSLPHGIPFSFHPASADIHRAIREQAGIERSPPDANR